MPTQADVVILGGGSGGYAAALRSAELGKSVILIEQDRVGGTCLHRGCIPTKALLHAAEVADTVRASAQVGVLSSEPEIDAAALDTWRRDIVAKKFSGLQGLIKARGITVVTGSGVLRPERTVEVDGEPYQGSDLILATGAQSAAIPGLEFSDRILDSERALDLSEIPQRVIVLGGGVIGVEFASLWRSLGSKVTIIEALEHLLPNEEEFVSRGLERAFRKRGIDLVLGTRMAEAVVVSDEVRVTLANQDQLTADYLLVAVGRVPATSELGLDQVGVQVNQGFIQVDDSLSTSVPGIWAVGDITPGPQLAHRGFAEGIAVAERIAGLRPAPLHHAQIPRVTYSSPEVASVGLTSAQAEEQYGAEQVVRFDYNLAGNAKSEILGTSGQVSVIREINGPILGVHMIGDRVGELITEGQLAVIWEAHPEDLADIIHAHPTQSEALGEAFLALAGKPLHTL